MGLTFGQVTDVLMLANHIPDERRSTFVARLKQWQKMGFPEGVNVGRGVRVEYGATQLYQLALHMRLLALGLTPERAQKIIRLSWTSLEDAIAATVVRKHVGDSDYCYLLIQYDALTDLKEGPSDHDHIYVSATMDYLIVEAFEGRDDIPQDEQGAFENFQLAMRNALVNAIVLEIDSIVLRVWGGMVKLGIEPQTLSADLRKWRASAEKRLKRKDKEPPPLLKFSDNLAGVEFCPGCFAAAMLGLRSHKHGEGDGISS